MAIPVDASYVHQQKEARFLGLLDSRKTRLKLYDIAPKTHDTIEDAREEIEGWGSAHLDDLFEAGDRGFVIHHRCGPDFRFLLPAVWRGNNELWEAVWYRADKGQPFAPFLPAYPDPSGAARPTFCVWELGVVTHEAASWTRFLGSARDDVATQAWEADGWSGAVR